MGSKLMVTGREARGINEEAGVTPTHYYTKVSNKDLPYSTGALLRIL